MTLVLKMLRPPFHLIELNDITELLAVKLEPIVREGIATDTAIDSLLDS